MKRFNFDYRKDPTDSRDLILSAKNTLQRKVDWSRQMSPVKNQGKLGSCVGFAVAAMKEWQEFKEYKQEIKDGRKGRKHNKKNSHSLCSMDILDGKRN